MRWRWGFVLALWAAAGGASAQTVAAVPDSGGADTAQQLSNPLASIISVPFQNNIDFGGRTSGTNYLLNVQPVVPIKLTSNLTLIARTILPIRDSGGDFGLGDASESLFLSPRSGHGFTYGFGPIILLQTATDHALGSHQLGLGPTAVVVQKVGPVLFGVLANHVWSVSGTPQDKEKLDATFIQPFVSYTFPTKTTIALNTESTDDWTARQWTVSVNIFINQLVTIDGQQIQFGVGPVTSPWGHPAPKGGGFG
jgi:hypothetical protein